MTNNDRLYSLINDLIDEIDTVRDNMSDDQLEESPDFDVLGELRNALLAAR